MISTSAICIAEFLTLYWLGLRLDYIPVPLIKGRFEPESTSGATESPYGPAVHWVPPHVDPRLQNFYREKSGYSVVTVTLAAAVIMAWTVVQVMHGAIVNASF